MSETDYKQLVERVLQDTANLMIATDTGGYVNLFCASPLASSNLNCASTTSAKGLRLAINSSSRPRYSAMRATGN